MIGLLFWASVVAAVFDWRYIRKGGKKPTRSDYGMLAVALGLCVIVMALFTLGGAAAGGLGSIVAILFTVVFMLWEFTRFRVRRANPVGSR